MMNRLAIRLAVTAVFLAASAASGAAFAVDEVDPNSNGNNTIDTAQHLTFATDQPVTVNAVMGVASGTPVQDVDFYSFAGKEGDIVTIDIDGGIKQVMTNGVVIGVDTNIALFAPQKTADQTIPWHIWAWSEDPRTPDSGSLSVKSSLCGGCATLDARIDSFRLPATGLYVVGVSSGGREFVDGGGLRSSILNANSNGTYTLIISGVSPNVVLEQMINIDVKPGSDKNPVNIKSKGKIPVALLSSSDFNALDVDTTSLTFGGTGDERSLVRCDSNGEDVNADGMLDLVCQFDMATAQFMPGDGNAVVKGKTNSGRAFRGIGAITLVPQKQQ